jgi:hypothetical protein
MMNFDNAVNGLDTEGRSISKRSPMTGPKDVQLPRFHGLGDAGIKGTGPSVSPERLAVTSQDVSAASSRIDVRIMTLADDNPDAKEALRRMKEGTSKTEMEGLHYQGGKQTTFGDRHREVV